MQGARLCAVLRVGPALMAAHPPSSGMGTLSFKSSLMECRSRPESGRQGLPMPTPPQSVASSGAATMLVPTPWQAGRLQTWDGTSAPGRSQAQSPFFALSGSALSVTLDTAD